MGLLRNGIPTVGAIGLALMGGGAAVMGGLRYLLRATFDAANQGFADGQVLDTVAEGVQEGQLTVVELDGTLAIVGNKCAFTAQVTPAWGDLALYSQGIARALGRGLLVSRVNVGAINTYGNPISWGEAVPPITDWVYAMYFQNVGTIMAWVRQVGGGGTLEWAVVGAYAAATDYELAIVLGGYDVNGVPWRSGEAAANYLYGAAWFVKGGAYATWTLLWRSALRNDATLYASMEGMTFVGTLD